MGKKAGRIAALLVAVGLGLLLYPSLRSLGSGRDQLDAIAAYRVRAEALTEADRAAILEAARSGNRALAAGEPGPSPPPGLDITGTGMLGYLEIPKIHCAVPIYSGAGEEALRRGAGQLLWSSLPVGGDSTHSVLSGHRGLPEAVLFTDLDQLEPGDRFFITVLTGTLEYTVEQTETVNPWETASLKIQEGQDLCTLVTCTPYGINSHRLLVHGRRTGS